MQITSQNIKGVILLHLELRCFIVVIFLCLKICHPNHVISCKRHGVCVSVSDNIFQCDIMCRDCANSSRLTDEAQYQYDYPLFKSSLLYVRATLRNY